MSGKGGNKQAAELFYYLNRTGYNGLCRFNSKGEFNVPFGRYKRINYTKNFSAYREIFSKWEFQCEDFASLPIKPGDFIYADPPYDVQFTKYAKEDFSWADQVRLAEFLSAHEGPVVLSNQATERIVRLYERRGSRFNSSKARAASVVRATAPPRGRFWPCGELKHECCA